jgi:hypothetical protein
VAACAIEKIKSVFKKLEFCGSLMFTCILMENGKIFWSKNGFKELVTTGFLKHFIVKKKDPSVSDTAKQAPKKVKKDAKPATNPEVSQGS